MELLKVLIADDEPMIREGLSDMLVSYSLPLSIVGTAKNGTEALNLTKMLEPNIIVTDICMPKLSGLEFIKRLQNEHPKAMDNLKIIILSGFNEFEYARQAIQLGVCAYLLKPINEQELKKTLESCIPINNSTTCEAEVFEDTFVRDCMSILKQEYCNGTFDLTMLAQKVSVNADYLSRKLKNETGLSFKEWLTKLRIQKSIELLSSRHYTICEVSAMVGYSNQHYFSTAFKNYTGHSPKFYQESHYAKI